MPVVLMFLKKYWFHAVVVAVVIYFATVAYGRIYQSGYDQANAEWEAKWNVQAEKLASDRIKAEIQQREIEQNWQSKINEAQRNAESQIVNLEADLIAANSSAVGLREQARRLAERASKACNKAGTASSGTTGATAGMVLADVLARIDERAGELAKAYDRARIAGLTCEKAYDSSK